MSEHELLCEVIDGVATLTINRPESRNTLSWGVIAQMREHFAVFARTADVRAVVITGAGEKAFSAGADLSGMAEGAAYADLHHARGELAALFGDMWDAGVPTIAKVRGYCLAGGFGLAMACDMVVATPDAQFGTPEINVGLWPYMITVPLLRSMPPKKALELMMTGRRVGAEEGERSGFVSRCVAEEEIDTVVSELGEMLASKSGAIMAMGRSSFYSVLDLSARDALAQLHPLLTVTTGFEDAAEGITAFLEKRTPHWKGR